VLAGGLRDQAVEVGARFDGQAVAVLEQCPAQPFEARIGALFEAPGLVERGGSMSDEMELVEADAGIGQVVGDPFDEGRRHVDADRADLRRRPVVFGQIIGEAADGGGVAALGNEHDLAFDGVGGKGQVMMAASVGGLLDRHRDHRRQIGRGHREIDIARADRVHAVPGCVDQSGDRGERHLLRHCQNQRLEQQGEAGQLAEPIGLDQHDSPVGQFDPWCSHLQVVFVLEEIEVPQALGLRVIDRVRALDTRRQKPAAGD
jgi:hypothetical protein